MNYDEFYKLKRSKETYSEHLLNNNLAEFDELLIKYGIRKGTIRSIYYKFKYINDITEGRFIFNVKEEIEIFGLFKGIKAYLIYLIVRVGF